MLSKNLGPGADPARQAEGWLKVKKKDATQKLNLMHIEAGHPFRVWGCSKALLEPVVLEVLGCAMLELPFYVHLTSEKTWVLSHFLPNTQHCDATTVHA